MKLINGILKLLGVAGIALLLYGLVQLFIENELYKYGLYGLGIILCVLIYYLVNRYENEREISLEFLENNLKYQKGKVKEYKKIEIDLINEIGKLIKDNTNLKRDLSFQVKATDDAEKLLSDYLIKKEQTIPFGEQDNTQDNEQAYTCLQCGSDNVRETPKMIICNECGKRRKK